MSAGECTFSEWLLQQRNWSLTKDTIVTVIKGGQLSQCACEQRFWADAAHLTSNVDSFWKFLFFFFFFFGWHCWRLPVLNYSAYTKWIQRIKHVCLCVTAIIESSTQISQLLALQFGVCQKFTEQVPSLAESKGSIPLIRRADWYPHEVSTFY